MGYYIKKLLLKKSLPHWKVQYISWKKEDVQNSKAKKPKRECDISKSRWSTLEFMPMQTRERHRIIRLANLRVGVGIFCITYSHFWKNWCVEN